MITAERRPSDVTERPRASRPRHTRLRVAVETAVTSEPPPAAAADPQETGDGTGLLGAFVVTTLLMVVGITWLAVLQAWWLLVPVVLVHWAATYVILAWINRLLAR